MSIRYKCSSEVQNFCNRKKLNRNKKPLMNFALSIFVSLKESSLFSENFTWLESFLWAITMLIVAKKSINSLIFNIFSVPGAVSENTDKSSS